MPSFNRVTLMGNITRDVELRYTPANNAVCDISLAVNRTWFDKAANAKKEETTFVDVTLWGRTAEIAQQYAPKGATVLVEGRLQLETWDDKQTGQKRSKLKVVGESLVLIGGKPAGGGSSPQRGPGLKAAADLHDFGTDGDDGTIPF